MWYRCFKHVITKNLKPVLFVWLHLRIWTSVSQPLINGRGDPLRWPRDTPLSAKVSTSFADRRRPFCRPKPCRAVAPLDLFYLFVSQPLWDRGPVKYFFIKRGSGPNKFTRKYLSIFLSSYIKLTQVLIINYGIIIKSISTLMFTVWHVDKYKITFKLVTNHWTNEILQVKQPTTCTIVFCF